MIKKLDFDECLKKQDTIPEDYARMHRIAGFGDYDRKRISEIMEHINERLKPEPEGPNADTLIDLYRFFSVPFEEEEKKGDENPLIRFGNFCSIWAAL